MVKCYTPRLKQNIPLLLGHEFCLSTLLIVSPFHFETILIWFLCVSCSCQFILHWQGGFFIGRRLVESSACKHAYILSDLELYIALQLYRVLDTLDLLWILLTLNIEWSNFEKGIGIKSQLNYINKLMIKSMETSWRWNGIQLLLQNNN